MIENDSKRLSTCSPVSEILICACKMESSPFSRKIALIALVLSHSSTLKRIQDVRLLLPPSWNPCVRRHHKARIPIYICELFGLWAHPWTCLNWMQSSCGQAVELNALGCQSAWSVCTLVRFACRAQVNPFKVEQSHGFLGNYYRAALPVTHSDIHIPDPHSIGFIGKDANSHWAGTDRNGLYGQTAIDKLIWQNSSRSWVLNQRVWHCLASSIYCPPF